MTITQQDLKLFASSRLTDTPDGGGAMTNQVLTGKDNELFNPISDVDRTMGDLSARLVYPAVLRNDTAGLLGANVILSQKPEADNVGVVLVAADGYAQERASIMERIEAYRVPTVETRFTVLGTARKGSRIVQVYAREDVALPVVGQVFALRLLQDGVFVYDFIRVANLSHSMQTFEDDKGEFKRRVITLTINQALERDFIGVEEPSRFKATPPARFLDTQIADSAKYYGIKPIVAAITKNSASIKLSSIYEQLVPVSTVETAIADDWAAGRSMYIETGAEEVLFYNGAALSGSLFFNTGILPGSLKIDGWTDNAQGSLSRGDEVVNIDYANGVLSGLNNFRPYTVRAIPAVQIKNAAYSTYINLDDTNVGTDWAPLLNPEPARGSTQVSYRVKGQWYDLIDYGDFVLRDNEGKQRGNISANGSCIISLPEIPDSPSQIIISWSPRNFYKTLDDKESNQAIAPKMITSQMLLQMNGGYLLPGTVKLTWNGGSAQDNGSGELTGDCSGKVDYATGQILPVGLNAASVNVATQQYSGALNSKTVAVFGGGNGGVDVTAVVGTLAKGSLKMELSGDLVSQYNWRVRGWVSAKNGTFANTFDYVDETGSKQFNSSGIVVVTDNGNGGLLIDGEPAQGSIDYATGKMRIKSVSLMQHIDMPEYSQTQVLPGSAPILTAGKKNMRRIEAYFEPTNSAKVATLSATDTRPIVQNIDTGLHQYAILQGMPYPNAVLLNSWVFDVNGEKVIEKGGTLYKNWNPLKNSGEVVGTLSASGLLRLNVNQQSTVKIIRGVWVNGNYQVKQFCGRTAIAPIKPQSFSAYCKNNGKTLSGIAQADEAITGDITGTIHYETGFFSLTLPEAIAPDSLRYNAVSQSTLPLDSNIIGINATRLPANGKVLVFRKGDLVVIHNTLKHDLGSSFTAAQTVQLPRVDLDRLCLTDQNGKHIDIKWYDYDLEKGQITFANPLDLSDYVMPLTAHCVWEEENRVSDTHISGSLKLQFGVSRDYPIEGTYVSSALVGGDLLVRASEPFSQKAWTNEWQNTRIAAPILAKLNVNDYPIKLTSNGAITERWLIKFKTSNTFELYGERLGLVLESDTLNDLAPINPATGKPYFRLPRAAFGAGGFESQNCVRFNTFGTPLPVWIVRSVQPSAQRKLKRDGFNVCLRGNTEA